MGSRHPLFRGRHVRRGHACSSGSIGAQARAQLPEEGVQLGGLDWYGPKYLGAADPASPLASPLFADLAGLPPLLIQVGGHEIMLDDAIELARAAALADVEVALEIGAELPHVFQNRAGELDEADAALARAGAFIRARLGAALPV